MLDTAYSVAPSPPSRVAVTFDCEAAFMKVSADWTPGVAGLVMSTETRFPWPVQNHTVLPVATGVASTGPLTMGAL